MQEVNCEEQADWELLNRNQHKESTTKHVQRAFPYKGITQHFQIITLEGPYNHLDEQNSPPDFSDEASFFPSEAIQLRYCFGSI